MTERTDDSYRVLLEGGQGEYEEKRSRFIATLRPCEREEEAVRFIEEMKKRYWDARHNCWAYRVGPKGELARCGDDGEPGGSAGRPMLETLIGQDVGNAAVVVSRYFGGVLLGTGGLARAYARAVQEGLLHCRLGRMRLGREVEVETDYDSVGKVLYLLRSAGIEPVFCKYEDKVTLGLRLGQSQEEALLGRIADATAGRARVRRGKALSFIDKASSQG